MTGSDREKLQKEIEMLKASIAMLETDLKNDVEENDALNEFIDSYHNVDDEMGHDFVDFEDDDEDLQKCCKDYYDALYPEDNTLVEIFDRIIEDTDKVDEFIKDNNLESFHYEDSVLLSSVEEIVNELKMYGHVTSEDLANVMNIRHCDLVREIDKIEAYYKDRIVGGVSFKDEDNIWDLDGEMVYYMFKIVGKLKHDMTQSDNFSKLLFKTVDKIREIEPEVNCLSINKIFEKTVSLSENNVSYYTKMYCEGKFFQQKT